MRRSILALGVLVLGTSGAVAQWGGYSQFDFRCGVDPCWRASLQARDFERAVWRDGRVSKDEWRILRSLRAHADRVCYRSRWRRY